MQELQNLIIEYTPKSPQIDLNRDTGEIVFSGKSIPENTNKVYEPVFNWVKEYILIAKQVTNIRIKLEYFNTSTSIWLAKILKVLIQIKNPGNSLILHLYLSREDFDDIEEFGDISDVFAPISGLFLNAILKIGIKIYGIDDDGKIIRDKLIHI